LKITDVTAGGPAANAGIAIDDKIVAIEGIPLDAIKPDIAKKLLSSGVVGVGQTVKLGLEKGSIVSMTAVKW
jgi:predicted metalloprotease with PDZ domain